MLRIEIVEPRIVDAAAERQVEIRVTVINALEVNIRHLPTSNENSLWQMAAAARVHVLCGWR